MPNKKISQHDPVVPESGDDLIIRRGTENFRISVDALKDWICEQCGPGNLTYYYGESPEDSLNTNQVMNLRISEQRESLEGSQQEFIEAALEYKYIFVPLAWPQPIGFKTTEDSGAEETNIVPMAPITTVNVDDQGQTIIGNVYRSYWKLESALVFEPIFE